jgi:hypothetical protein
VKDNSVLVYGANAGEVMRKIRTWTSTGGESVGIDRCKCERCRAQRKLIREETRQRREATRATKLARGIGRIL